jgi:hypothetical protein
MRDRFLVQAVFTRDNGSQVLVDIWASPMMGDDVLTLALAVSMAERDWIGATWGPPLEGKLS